MVFFDEQKYLILTESNLLSFPYMVSTFNIVIRSVFLPQYGLLVLYGKLYSFSLYFLVEDLSQINFCVWGDIRVLCSVFFNTDTYLFHSICGKVYSFHKLLWHPCEKAIDHICINLFPSGFFLL